MRTDRERSEPRCPGREVVVRVREVCRGGVGLLEAKVGQALFLGSPTGLGEHRCRYVDAEDLALRGLLRGDAAGLAASAANVEDLVRPRDRGRAHEPGCEGRQHPVVAILVLNPVSSSRAVPAVLALPTGRA